MTPIYLTLSLVFIALTCVQAFNRIPSMRSSFPKVRSARSGSSLHMLDLSSVEMNTQTYAVMALVTLVPSFAFVKFVGDAADTSRGKLSDETRASFKRSMMDQPGRNLALPTSEEEALKKAVAKAYMQDKDVDVAVLEEKLRKRAQWRKEMMANQKAGAEDMEDEDGW